MVKKVKNAKPKNMPRPKKLGLGRLVSIVLIGLMLKYLIDLEKMYGDSPRKTTSLIDRAKEMNRKHPRMGSGRK